MKKLCTTICIFLLNIVICTSYVQAASSKVVLNADFRHRPPELIVNNNKLSGPLKDILEEAAANVGVEIRWRHAHFVRSIKELENGSIDIIPKTFRTKSRESFITYLGPLFTRTQHTKFLVKKGNKNLINKYEDLWKLKVGVKRGSFYFTKFNNDSKINRVKSFDDFNMSHMFIKDRFDTMAVIDPIAIEQELRKRDFYKFEYANFEHVRKMGLYYAFSKKSKHHRYAKKLDRQLIKMTRNGRIKTIYEKYKLAPTSINKVLIADFRHRPPEMTIKSTLNSGPLKEIIDTAANRIGFTVKWNVTPFANSIKRLKEGFVDIVPRTIKTKNRKKFARFLGPVGYFRKDIHFLVAKGAENSIRKYSDLKRYKVGIKSGTYYFEKFQNDKSVKKVISIDDSNMSHMFIKKRFDVMAVLDPLPLVEALHQRGFTNFSFAKYKYQNDFGIYFAFSKKSANQHIFEKLNRTLIEMYDSGEVNAIFKKHNVVPPLNKVAL